jgi:peroxiredoxin
MRPNVEVRAALQMVRIALLGAAILICAAVFAAGPPPKIAPGFVLTDCINADTLRLADYSGQPVLLFFYDGGDMASHNLLPYVNEWHRRYEGDGLKVIGIHSPEFEALKLKYNAAEVVSRAKLAFPVGFDSSRSVYATYGLKAVPTFILLKPGLEIVLEASRPKSYVEIETAIQNLLVTLKPGIVNPFIVRPFKPADDPSGHVLPATPMLVLGHNSAAIANLDSAAYGKFKNYSDSRDRLKGKVFLQGYWKVGPSSISYEQQYRSSEDHLRVVYTGKDVWLLALCSFESPPRLYVKQDMDYLPKEDWGEDMQGDLFAKPYINMRYSIPMHIIKNRAYGTHSLEIIPAEGDVSLYYLFFEGAAAE